LSTIGFQIISNFANDYGDGMRGTDNEQRVGPERMIQSGAIRPKQLMGVIRFSIILTFLIAVLLIYRAFGLENWISSVIFIVLGVASIAAALKYTMGRKAYGYVGLGDLFVLLFFGFLSVSGSHYLYTLEFDALTLLPAAAVGCLSTGVLNLNNMRDLRSDRESGKRTLAVLLGPLRARSYHIMLSISAFVFTSVYVYMEYRSPVQFMYLLAFIPIFKNAWFVATTANTESYDPELKKLALSTFLYALTFGAGCIISV
jgi:1,4-dihydroxy-2-naphthoate octaprenyltransferase